MNNRELTTINDSMNNTDLRLMAVRLMPDGAMAIAIEYMGDVVVTRMYLTELTAYIHQHHLKKNTHPALIGANSPAKFKFEINNKDYYILTPEQYHESNFHRIIPEYRAVSAIEYKG